MYNLPRRSFSTGLPQYLKSFGSKSFYSLPDFAKDRLNTLPISIRVLLESALRNFDNFSITQNDLDKILNWAVTSKQGLEIPFKPARVILQDFTGVSCVADLAAMRDTLARLNLSPAKINPRIPVDLVIDHSVMADYYGSPESLGLNEELEFQRNYERFQFLKWGNQAFKNLNIVPPGSGIVHQVNMEYLARTVVSDSGLLYPDSVVGTDSHTTMINGLGVLGWGVGGIEAESVMLGQPISMVLPEVIGFHFKNSLKVGVTATDLALRATEMLRKKGVVGKFVEFFGEGTKSLGSADKATIANMAPEYGATMGFFPVDDRTLDYLTLTGKSAERVKEIEDYLKQQKLFQSYQENTIKYTDVLELDLDSVEPALAGPKRPQDRINLKDVPKEFKESLKRPVGARGFGLQETDASTSVTVKGETHLVSNGSVFIAAITSCTNTSNPESMVMAGLLAKNAVAKGLKVPTYIKTTLSPGSKVVTKYLEATGLDKPMKQLGFETVGYGCMTCIGNSGDLLPEVNTAIQNSNIIACAVLSGNRNFEARIHPLLKANYLASPPLVIAYALAGSLNHNFNTTPLGKDEDGKDVYLKDIWPTTKEARELLKNNLHPDMFIDVYNKTITGNKKWNDLEVPKSEIFDWKADSTYIKSPPFFEGFAMEIGAVKNIEGAHCLLSLGDSVTTDHISPAGNIAKTSPAGLYLQERGIKPKDFNSYGSRRGHDSVMTRGTFANTRIANKLITKVGPFTIHHPTNEVIDIFTAAERYKSAGTPTIVLAGKEYGTGSSRDWAAKGPYLLGVKAVIAQSFERIHRSNLVGMGVLPLMFKDGQDAESLGLTGKEKFSFDLKGGEIRGGEEVEVRIDDGRKFNVICRLDTEVEREYYRNGGILQYVMRKLAKETGN